MGPFGENYLNIIFYILISILLIAFLYLIIRKIKKSRLLSKWKRLSQDNLIVHCVPRAKTLPNPSPFVMKLITYIKMANIKYQIDYTDPFGPTGKTPWISYKGKFIGDSELCIEYLNKEFGINLNEGFSKKEIAASDSLRIMMDEHFVWGMFLTRFGNVEMSSKVLPFSKLFIRIVGILMRHRSKAQGIGSHTNENIIKFMIDDLRILSDILCENNFILGEKVCQNDAAIFGQLVEILYGLPGSHYEQALHEKFTNLKLYCERMREIYWKNDWETENNSKNV